MSARTELVEAVTTLARQGAINEATAELFMQAIVHGDAERHNVAAAREALVRSRRRARARLHTVRALRAAYVAASGR